MGERNRQVNEATKPLVEAHEARRQVLSDISDIYNALLNDQDLSAVMSTLPDHSNHQDFIVAEQLDQKSDLRTRIYGVIVSPSHPKARIVLTHKMNFVLLTKAPGQSQTAKDDGYYLFEEAEIPKMLKTFYGINGYCPSVNADEVLDTIKLQFEDAAKKYSNVSQPD